MDPLVSSAFVFATDAHREQKRKASGDPYIIHPIRVVDILVMAGVTDPATLAAAVLHDVVEDTPVTLDEIGTKFGLVVKAIVAEVTNDLNLSRADRKRAQVRKAGCTSVRARLVKLADMIDNLTDLLKCKPPGWTSARLQGYFIWKRAVFDAGLSGLNEKLDDQAERLFGAVSMVDDDLDGDHHEWPVIPKGDTTDLLEAYYASFD